MHDRASRGIIGPVCSQSHIPGTASKWQDAGMAATLSWMPLTVYTCHPDCKPRSPSCGWDIPTAAACAAFHDGQSLYMATSSKVICAAIIGTVKPHECSMAVMGEVCQCRLRGCKHRPALSESVRTCCIRAVAANERQVHCAWARALRL